MKTKPSIIEGWHFNKEEYEKAHEEDRLVKLVTELSNVCNLSCPSCFTKKVDGSWTKKGKKRLRDELSYEDQIALINEAKSLGIKTVDIVGAGEPLLDTRFESIMNYLKNLNLHSVVFTHGATPNFQEIAQKFEDNKLSLFIKLWSQNPALQQIYVGGSVPNYLDKRDQALQTLIDLGYNSGKEIAVDGINYQTTRIGADILVMKSNYNEILDIFRYCRQNNIMPEIKTYIPEGPTRFSHELAKQQYSYDELKKLREDEVSPKSFEELRKEIERIDQDEFGIAKMDVIYPQACKCTQSTGSLYVTIQGDVRSCVGTHHSFGKYMPHKDILRKTLQKRKSKENVSFDCIPRIEEEKARNVRN